MKKVFAVTLVLLTIFAINGCKKNITKPPDPKTDKLVPIPLVTPPGSIP